MSTTRRLLLYLLLVAATLALRAPFLQHVIWNVDEGITATAAEQILAGGVLYRDVADQRSPLVPYLKAGIFAAFGNWNTTAVHVVLALLLGLGAVALWQLARRLGHDRAGFAAAVVFTVLCFMLPSGEDAMAAHTEWFLLAFSVAGFLAFAAAVERPGFVRGLGVGALFGLAFLCKQPGLLDWAVSLVLIVLLLWTRPAPQRGALLRLAGGSIAGFSFVVVLTIGYFVYRGAAADLLYYAWSYNNQVYVPAIPLPERLLTMREPFLLAARHAPFALILGLLGALVLPVVVIRGLRDRRIELPLLLWLGLGWTVSGIIASGLSGRGFSHYSIQVIPGLSLVCGCVLGAGWGWCSVRGRPWRLAAVALLLLAAVDTGLRVVQRVRALAAHDNGWIDHLQIVRRLTLPTERIFVWGFAPDCYVHARRLPATRFVYNTFLTGLIPWANLDPLIDTAPIVTPGSWNQLTDDFRRTPPAMIIDTGAARNQSKYPLHDQVGLWSLITREFAEVHVGADQSGDLRFYRRLAPVVPGSLPAAAVVAGSVNLKLEYTKHLRPTPLLTLTAPDGASRVDLFANGQRFRSLPLPDGHAATAFFLPASDLPQDANVFVAVVHYPAGPLLSPSVSLSREDAGWQADRAPGPAIRFLGREIRPWGSESPAGAPITRTRDPEIWQTPVAAKLVYARPAGLRSVRVVFGLDEAAYYDRADRRASDGVDFVVEHLDRAGVSTRLYARRLHPKTDQRDCGPQVAEIDLPNTGPGWLVVRVLPGAANDSHCDWAYLHTIEGTAYGPPLFDAGHAIPAERVSAHHDPVMTCDPDGKWTAHSPSSVGYVCPAGPRTLVFDYGLEPSSYDGSQGGRSDGISVVVTAESVDGTVTTLFARALTPVETEADRGRQTSRVDLPGHGAERVTITIGPGAGGNFSYDWSYLAALRLESPGAVAIP